MRRVRARVGGVKNGRFLFPAKKAVDACRAVVLSGSTDNWVCPWLSRHVSSQYSPTGSTRFDVWEDKFTRYKPTCYVSKHTMVYEEGE